MLACDALDTTTIQTHLFHDVTDTDCQTQMAVLMAMFS